MKTDNTKTMPNTKTTTGNKTTEEGYRMPGNKTADKWTSPAQTEFHCFFVDQLKDIYWAEKHLKKGLKKMSKAATSPKLRDAFEKHYNEGDKQIAELETIFGLMGEKPETKRCEAMAGLLEEADGMISDTQKNSFVRDAGLILAAQKVEHYEIATTARCVRWRPTCPRRKSARCWKPSWQARRRPTNCSRESPKNSSTNAQRWNNATASDDEKEDLCGVLFFYTVGLL